MRSIMAKKWGYIITKIKPIPMNTTYKTNLQMAVLAYCQKAIAVAVGCYLALYYLLPILLKATDLPKLFLIGFTLFGMVVFEGILHVSLMSYIKGYKAGEKQVTNLVGGIIAFGIIAVLGWYSADNLPYFRASIQEKASLMDIDSIRRVHGEASKHIESTYNKKLSDLDSLYLPILSSQKNNAWSLAQTQSTYNQSRSLLLSEKETELEKINKQVAKELADAQSANEKIITDIERQDKGDAKGVAILSIVILVFSLYSTIAIGNYQKPTLQTTEIEVQSTEIETVVQNVPTKPETVVQSQQSAVQNNITIVMSSDTRKSEKRLLAEEYVLSNQLFEMEDLKDKEKFQKLNQDLERESGTSISWGLYSQIKKEWKEGVLG